MKIRGGHDGYALQVAVQKRGTKQEVLIQLLLDNKADVKAQGGYYWNTLQAAAHANNQRNKTAARPRS